MDDARRAYERAIAISPDSAFLHRELGQLERRAGNADRALERLGRAVELDPNDAAALVETAELLEARGDASGAEAAYRKASAIDPSLNLGARIAATAELARESRLPVEFRAALTTAQITRGDLAALIGVRLAGLVRQAPARQIVVTDAQAHWASAWINETASAGIIEPFENHTFQPRTPVRRGDLAIVINRLLALIASADPSLKQRLAQRPTIADVPPATSSIRRSHVCRRGWRHATPRWRSVSGGPPGLGGGGRRGDRSRAGAGGDDSRRVPPVKNLTLANQLTILRIALIPAFVLLVVYGYLGAALLVFSFAGLTDALDGLIARRAGQRTSLGAWLDPMADKLLLVTTFVVLTLPGIQLTNHLPLWLTVLVISRDVVIVGVVAIINLAVGPRTFRPSFLGKATTAAFIITSVIVMFFNYRHETSLVVDLAIWVSLALTLISSGDYFIKLRRLITEAGQ